MSRAIAALLFLAMLLVPAALSAQRRFLNVPGQYPRAELAIDAARNGDTILVQHRVDPSTNWRIDGKAITIIGNATAITGSGYDRVEFRNIPAGQDLVVEGFNFSPRRIVLENCAGRVSLEGVYGTRRSNAVLDDVQLDIRDCRQVMVTRCGFEGGPAVRVLRSDLTLTQTPLRGFHAQDGAYRQAAPAMHATASQIRATASRMIGGAEIPLSPFFPPAPAIVSDQSEWVVAGPVGTQILAGLSASDRLSAVVGTGTIAVDPNVSVQPRNGAPAFDPALSVTRPSLATLRAVLLGSRLTTDLRARPNSWFALLAGNPGEALTVPGLGSFRLDPRAFGTVGSGPVPNSGTYTLSVPILVSPAIIGRRLMLQAVVDTGSGFELTNAAGITAH